VGPFVAARDARGAVLRPLESQARSNNYQYVTKPSRLVDGIPVTHLGSGHTLRVALAYWKLQTKITREED